MQDEAVVISYRIISHPALCKKAVWTHVYAMSSYAGPI